MPVIGSRHADGVHGLVGDDLAEVLDRLHAFEAESLRLCLRLFEGRLVDIANRNDLDAGRFAGIPDVGGAHFSGADERNIQLVVGAPDVAGEQ